jgi:5-hydroxyisourate hydrolase
MGSSIMSAITTHVLDTARGKPAGGIPITLERKNKEGAFERLGAGVTDSDGRLRDLMKDAALSEGVYRITFDVDAYHRSVSAESFYPEVSVVFVVKDAAAHYHVPLLLSPFGFSTYRGS